MDFLALCRRTASECGVSSTAGIRAALPSVDAATGSMARIVNWVNDAWTELQTAREDWEWMRSSGLLGGGVTFRTRAGRWSYPLGYAGPPAPPLVVAVPAPIVAVPVTPVPAAGDFGGDLAGDFGGAGGTGALAAAGSGDFGGGDFGGDLGGAAVATLAAAGTATGDFGGDLAGDFGGATATITAPAPVVPVSIFNGSDFGGDFGTGDLAGSLPDAIPPADLFGRWDTETFRCYPALVGTAGEMFLDEISFDQWRNGYMIGAMRQVQTRPIVVAIGPDQSVNLGPPPTDGYIVTADYFLAPSSMAADTDVPFGLPKEFHMLIVYRAMMKYGGYESAPEVYQRGAQEAAPLFSRLLARRGERASFGGALA